MSISGEPNQPHPAALMLALDLVTNRRLRLTDQRDSRLGPLAGMYELGAASWTGARAAFVGFYRPPPDPVDAGQDLAERCHNAMAWGAERLATQGAQRCHLLLVALGPVSGSLASPPPGAVSVGAVAADPTTGAAHNLLASPTGMPGAREVSAAVRAVLAGQPAPTLAAVDLAERQAMAAGYAAPPQFRLRAQP